MFLKQPPCPLWTLRLSWPHVPTIVQVELWTECENWAEGYSYKERGRGRNRGNNFISTCLVRVKVTVWVSWSTLTAEVNSAHKKIVYYYAPCSAVNGESSRLAGWLHQYWKVKSTHFHWHSPSLTYRIYVLSAYPRFGCWWCNILGIEVIKLLRILMIREV